MIKLKVLGGGDEVGASCYLLQIGHIAILLDAGMRLKGNRKFPNFSSMYDLVESWSKINSIFISHGHLDHVGSLLKVYDSNPQIQIRVPVGSKAIIRTQLKTNFRQDSNEKEIDLDITYSKELIAKCLHNIQEVPFNKRQKIKRSNIYFEFWPAGHIIGSASIFFETLEGNILYTGDICKFHRLSIPDLTYRDVKIDYLISESTYLHNEGAKDPNESFALFYKEILEITSKGGNVLIPSFALGKAQELIRFLIESNLQNSKYIPILLDGMVNKVTRIYIDHYGENYLPKNQENLIKFQFIRKNVQNYIHANLSHRGVVIIASSGMLLKGSRSSYWAEAIFQDVQSAIFFSGYLDEESPGFFVNKLRNNEKFSFYNSTDPQPIQCQIKKYHLGTHINRIDLIHLIRDLSPDKVFFVHGNVKDQDIMALRVKIEAQLRRKVELTRTKNMEIYTLSE